MAIRILIEHPDFGIYLGNCLGMGFWTKLDCAGQTHAVTFDTADQAKVHVEGWESHSDPYGYFYRHIETKDPHYATIEEIEASNLGTQFELRAERERGAR